MQFPPNFLDELRSRLRPSQIIGKRISLKSKGRGEFIGLCPFHGDKDPSLTVTDEKGFYHCFACGAHGDIIKFVTQYHGLSFQDAVKELAAEAGMPLPTISKAQQEQYDKMSKEYAILESACKWFEEQLQLSAGSHAREYLTQRNISSKTTQTFRLGFASESWDGLKTALLAQDYSEQELVEAGLIVKKDGKAQTFDRFRNRIMFPIMDSKGRVVAFGGRILGDGQPKYLNSPETTLFKKGHLLYGWHLARQIAYEKSSVAIVEGYMDVIALHQAGIKNAVAPLGTALTENQLRLLWNVVREPVLCMDGDEAGRRAMFRAAETYLPILKPGLSLKFAALPENMDPDDIIVHRGSDTLRNILGNADTLSNIIWQYETSTHPLKTPEQKADLQQRLMRRAETIQDKTVQDFYRKDFNQRLWDMGLNKKRQGVKRLTNINVSSISAHTPQERYEIILLKLLLHFPSIMHDESIENDLLHIDFFHPRFNELREAMLGFAMEKPHLSEENLSEALENQGFNNEINYIKGCKFLESFAKKGTPFNVVTSEWRYILALYNLTITEQEYARATKQFQQDVTEEAQNQILALQKQLDSLQLIVAKEKKHCEALLEE